MLQDPPRGYPLRRAFLPTPPPSSNYGSAKVFSILKGLGRLVVSFDVEDSYTTVSKNVISFSEISAVNFIVRSNVLACSMNRSMSFLLTSHREKTSSVFCSSY